MYKETVDTGCAVVADEMGDIKSMARIGYVALLYRHLLLVSP